MNEQSHSADAGADEIKIWNECLAIIKENVPFITFNTWFIPIKPLKLIDSTLKIQVPNNFFIEWIDGHYNTLISKTIKQVLGEDAELVYVILDEKENNDQPKKVLNDCTH